MWAVLAETPIVGSYRLGLLGPSSKAIDSIGLAGIAPVDAIEELCSRGAEGGRQLGDGPHSRLALAALDLGDVRRIEIGYMSQPFLAQALSLSDAS